MPLLSPTERRSPRGRAFVAAMYLLLGAGALSMVYPFLLMVAGSTQSGVDAAEHRILPAFLVDDDALYRKYAEGLFNESLRMMQAAYDLDVPSFRALDPPAAVNRARAEDWARFLAERPPAPHAWTAGFLYAPVSKGVQPHVLRAFKGRLDEAFGGDLQRMNAALDRTFDSWNTFYMLPEDYLGRIQTPATDAMAAAFDRFKTSPACTDRYYFSLEGYYRNGYLKNRYTRNLDAYNAAHGTAYAAWDEVRLPERLPPEGAWTAAERADWETFARDILNLLWVRPDPAAAPAWQAFLQARYAGRREARTRVHGTGAATLPDDPQQLSAVARTDWALFVQGWKDPADGRLYRLPGEHLRLTGLDFDFRRWLEKRRGTIAGLNAAWATDYPDWAAVRPPQREAQYLDFLGRRAFFRREFATRNYRSVFDYVALRGRALVNTAIYCGLSILLALLVNPLAAYALSRFRPRATYKILLFLMLTMAFPPMVTQIPVFLMLRDLRLLNTFWALVLPAAANGYSIFLLKGFFDALPRELYESAEIDGAGEFRLFAQITLSLSKPILAVLALNAFTLAYANFMHALLICQDERMWTLMPWLYQLQQRSGPGILYASLIIAALPTFLVFLFCQNIILRGIVVPVEK